MSLLDFVSRWTAYPVEEPVQHRSAALSNVAEALYEAIGERQATFSLNEALRLPAVNRGVALICSTAAQFNALAYRDGQVASVQPRIVVKPDYFNSRYDFIYQTVYGLVTKGNAFWKMGDFDPESGKPRTAMVVDPADVSVQWDERRILPVYTWRGVPMARNRDIKHISIGRRPGELLGRGPLGESLDALSVVADAEDFASGFFESGGIPMTVLKAIASLAPGEAEEAKRQYMAGRVYGEPAVMSQGWELMFPSTDPQKAQMQEARAYGATIVARLLGIPAPLLHVETSGSTIVYQNTASAIENLTKVTVQPQYLAPIEQAWSDLVPSTQVVRFDLGELMRTDINGRMEVYKNAIDSGIMTAQEARAFEGWGPLETEASHSFDAVPNPEEVTA